MSLSLRASIQWVAFGVYFSLLSLTLPAIPATAAVNVIHRWDMGTTDTAKGDRIGCQVDAPGGYGTPGRHNYSQPDLGTGPKIDLQNSVGVKGPIYSGNAAPGSTVAIKFTGDAYESLVSATCIKLIHDFGLQLWVKARDASDRMVVYNGNPAKNGWGIIQRNGHWDGLLGGTAFIKGARIVPGKWVNLALVVTSKKVKLYVNGKSYASFQGGPNPPSPAAGGDGFWIGSQRRIQTAYCSVDDVKIFTFTPGGFAARDLASAARER
ncbi:MAG: LamG-like jellyroll fold domain-containing protein [Phycisphaerae bacterium]